MNENEPLVLVIGQQEEVHPHFNEISNEGEKQDEENAMLKYI